MSNTITLTAGIDTSKAKLDVAVPRVGVVFQCANSPQGWNELGHRLAEIGATCVGIEASGGYERGVISVLRARDFDVRLLQPMQVKHYAGMRLCRAKNDTLDAGMIARATEMIEAKSVPSDEELIVMADHLTYIEQIEEDLSRLAVRCEHIRDERILDVVKADIAALEARRKDELKRLIACLKARPDLARRFDLVLSIPGIGRRTAVALIVRMPELGHLGREKIASLAGLAPFDDDSGPRSGARHVAGGRGRVRKSLYSAAFAAAYHWNPALIAFRLNLKERNKPIRLILVACARKLLTYANAVLQRGTPWVEKPAA